MLILKEMLGELFTPVETPEAPNRGFFKGLFGGGAQSLDREELCKLIHLFCVIDLKHSSHIIFYVYILFHLFCLCHNN